MVRRYKKYDCPEMKVGQIVEAIDTYECYKVCGKVTYNTNGSILVDLGKEFKQVGCIKGWLAEPGHRVMYRCIEGNYYWWFDTWRILKKEMAIE